MLSDFKKSNKGNITVFLCMIFGIVLVLILSVISVLRYRWEKTQIIRSGRIAVSSEFSKYYRPLYDSYRMFYYMDCDESQMQAGIGGYFMDNQENMPAMLALKPSYIDVTKKFYAISDKANNVVKQMKEASLQKGFEDLFENERDDDSDKKTLEEIENEIGVLKETAKAEKRVLDLMTIVEGIRVYEGEVGSVSEFAKKLIFEDVTPSAAGVDSELVWDKTKDNYLNAKDVLDKVAKIAKRAREGKSVSFPEEDITKLKEGAESTKQKTMQALEIIRGIRSMVPESSRGAFICDVDTFYNILNKNMVILEKIESFASKLKPVNKEGWERYLDEINALYNMISGYNVKGLRFDYSTLVSNKCEDPRVNVGDNVSKVLDILLDDEIDISDKYVEENDIYIKLMKEESEKSNDSRIYRFDNDFDGFEEFVGQCKENMSGEKGRETDKISVVSYVTMYLQSFNEKVTGDDDKITEHALEYEMEYLIAGNNSDEKNLEEVVNKLLIGRTGVSFAALATDAECRRKTFVTAQQLVGFSGMQALVKVVQYSVLAAWAYEDACVDIAILLDGNKISPLKNGKNINIKYMEMCSFGETLVRRKAQENKCETGMDYNKCLSLNLLAKKKSVILYRTMDVIQQNIKLSYDKRFSFQDAIYGAEIAFGCCEPYDSHAEISFTYE